MVSKRIASLISILMLVFLIGFASAAVFEMNKISAPTSVLNDAGSFPVVFNITYTGSLASITVDLSNSSLTTGTGSISFSQGPTNITLNQNETKTITATVHFDDGQTGNIAGTINATPSSGTAVSFSFSTALEESQSNDITDFCTYDNSGINDNVGDLRVKINDITVTGFGDNRKWFPFDEIELEVTVENKGDDDISDISLEWGLYDKNTEEWVIDIDEADSFDVDSDDDQVTTIKFKIDNKMDEDLNDLDDGENYVLYVRATGDVDNDNNDITCESDSEDINIVIEKNFAIVKNIEIPETVSCGSDLQISADVWNIGSKDQDSVSVKVYNKELNLSQIVDIGDINSFDSENLDLTLQIPKNAKEKSYALVFEVYDEDDDIFTASDDDQEARFTIALKIQGSCSSSSSSEASAIISANLESGGEAGKPLIIKAIITNTGTSSATLLLNAAGYNEWADSADLDKDTITLAPGTSQEVLFTFDVKTGVSGDKLFNIEAVSGDKLVVSQPVSVSITSSKFSFANTFGDKWYLWLIGLLNVILILIIIVVAVRVARRK